MSYTTKDYKVGKMNANEKVTEVDIEKTLNGFQNRYAHENSGELPSAIEIAKHFFELGLKAEDVNEIIKTAEDHAYFAGSENTREKLIEKACKWLKENAYFYVNDYTGSLNDDMLVNEFHKAMKE